MEFHRSHANIIWDDSHLFRNPTFSEKQTKNVRNLSSACSIWHTFGKKNKVLAKELEVVIKICDCRHKIRSYNFSIPQRQYIFNIFIFIAIYFVYV